LLLQRRLPTRLECDGGGHRIDKTADGTSKRQGVFLLVFVVHGQPLDSVHAFSICDALASKA